MCVAFMCFAVRVSALSMTRVQTGVTKERKKLSSFIFFFFFLIEHDVFKRKEVELFFFFWTSRFILGLVTKLNQRKHGNIFSFNISITTKKTSLLDNGQKIVNNLFCILLYFNF